MILHAGLLALFDSGAWRGVLVEGPSGAGKSDLALRALDHGFQLVADDRVLIWASNGALYGRAPDPLADLIEVRGLGVLPQPARLFCRIDLLVQAGEPERLPAPEAVDHLGVTLPRVVLALREASAPAKLRRALLHLGARPEGAYQARRVARTLNGPGGDSH